MTICGVPPVEFVLCQASKGNIRQLLLSVSKYLRDLVKSCSSSAIREEKVGIDSKSLQLSEKLNLTSMQRTGSVHIACM